VLLLATALLLGFLHGLGADHLMGIAALSVGRSGETAAANRSRALRVAVRFVAGHALLLAAGAAGLVILGWSLPLGFERGGEVLGGALLIALGGHGLYWHLYVRRQDRLDAPHSHLPTFVGAAFAVSSLRALALLAPFGDSARTATLPTLLLLIVLFAAGILMSMSLFGIAFAAVMSHRINARLGRLAAGTTALASIALGLFWIAT